MRLAINRDLDPRVQIVTERGVLSNNLETGIAIMTPFRMFFADGCAATAIWQNTTTDTARAKLKSDRIRVLFYGIWIMHDGILLFLLCLLCLLFLLCLLCLLYFIVFLF